MLGEITPKSYPLASCCSTTVHLVSLKISPSPFLIIFRAFQAFLEKQEYNRSNGFAGCRGSSGPLVCHAELKVRGGF